MQLNNKVQHVYLVGAKSLGAYGGYETFVYKLTEYHQNKENIKYHVACKANGDGCIRALFEGEQRVEKSQLKCEGVGQTKVSVSYHAVAEDWGEMIDSEINVLDKYIEKEALHAMMAVLTKKQRNLIYQNYVLDKTHQEIADGMGIARGSVTRSVNQALERIRRKFDFEAHYELAVGDFT